MCKTKGEIVALQKTMFALSDDTRRQILQVLKEKPLSAGDIASKFEISAPAVSRHLNVLKEADLIRDRREGKFIYYELNASVLQEILLWIKSLGGKEND